MEIEFVIKEREKNEALELCVVAKRPSESFELSQ